MISTTFITPIQNSYQNQKLKDIIDKCQHHSLVTLSRQQLTDEDINIVVKEAIINKQCKELWLDSTKITSAGISIIAKSLNENTTLKELLLSNMDIHFLTKALSLNNSSLWKLYFISVGITDEDIGYIAEMLKKNSTLHYVTLYKNNIGNRGIELLASTLIHHNAIP